MLIAIFENCVIYYNFRHTFVLFKHHWLAVAMTGSALSLRRLPTSALDMATWLLPAFGSCFLCDAQN